MLNCTNLQKRLPFLYIYVDKNSNSVLLFREIKMFRVKIAMIISANLSILSTFLPKYWLNWQILFTIFSPFFTEGGRAESPNFFSITFEKKSLETPNFP